MLPRILTMLTLRSNELNLLQPGEIYLARFRNSGPDIFITKTPHTVLYALLQQKVTEGSLPYI